MRQTDSVFSTILTKIGDGMALTIEENKIIESRFVSREFVDQEHPQAIRIFFRTSDVNQYNQESITGKDVIEYVANDYCTGYKTQDQLISARTKVHKLKPDETGGLPFMLRLLIGKPYMIRTNIDVIDSLVNGAIGILSYIEKDYETNCIKRLWLSFENKKIGKLLRIKAQAHIASNKEINYSWTPISLRTSTIQTSSKIITCKRTQFPIIEACAITTHKSQGGTFDKIVFEYSKSMSNN